MQSVRKNVSSSPTKTLYISQLPPLLVNWNTLKTHFSQYGKVHSVSLNPQRRSCTVSFETTADAAYAKAKGCVWKNKQLEAIFYSDDATLSDTNASSSPTRVLYISQLPPLLLNWNTLKTHFSQYGKVRSVVLNPQHRSCTVTFETTADALYAKSKGCVWKNTQLEAIYCSDDTVLLDPRAKCDEVFGYSELETMWCDDDIEQFGVAATKSPVEKIRESNKKERTPRRVKERLPPVTTRSTEEALHEDESRKIRISKVKSTVEKRSPKISKVKPDVEKKSPVLKTTGDKKSRSMIMQLKEKQKEAKKRVKEALLELSKKRRLLSSSKQNKEADADRPVLSLQEKFSLLEERDRLIRKSLIKSSNVETAKAVVGTCPDMCPEKERIMREYRRLVSTFEMKPGTQEMDHSIAVKAYVRSSADQEEPLSHELRPEPVLSMTMSYLIAKIMPLVYDSNIDISEWYDFCWDRLRSIRKDVIQQQLCSLETVTVLEQCARFHICCYDLFWGADPSVFDEKINTENLMNCLQTLRHMYEDLAKEDIRCPNEAEFYAYMILLNMKTGDLMATYRLFSEKLQKENQIQAAVKIYLSLNNFMYSQFFKLVKSCTYLDACLLQRYFYNVRVQALQAIARAYCPPNKGVTLPLKQIKNILKFDTAEDTRLFCEGHGIRLKENKRDFNLYRNDFFFPETKIKSPKSSSLITDKRLPLVVAVTGGRQYDLCSFKNHEVHSSFTAGGKLTELASDASDQKTKLSEMRVTQIKTCEFMYEDEEMVDEDMKSRSSFSPRDSSNDRVDGAETLEERHKTLSFAMDVDDVDITTRQDEENIIDPLEIKYLDSKQNVDTFINNDNVSKKRANDSSAFRFDVSAKASVLQSPKVSSLVNFGSAEAVNIFGTKNQSIDHQLKQNQFNLNINFMSQQTTEDNKMSVSGKDDFVESNKSASLLQMHDESSGVKESFVFNLNNKTLSSKAPVPSDSSGFTTFSFGSNANYVFPSEKKESVSLSEPSYQLQKANTEHKENKSPVFKLDFNKSIDRLNSCPSIFPVKHSPSDSELAYFKKNADRERKEIEQHREKKRLQEKEDGIMKQLKKDLRQRMKRVNATRFARRWKEKVDRIKLNRENFPLLNSTPIEWHDTIWGVALVSVNSLSTQSLLDRIKEKRHSFENANLILNDRLCSSVEYQGREIANSVVLNNSLKLGLRDFSVPFCWKLVVSIPFPEDSFYTKKFNLWLNKVFYKSDNTVTGDVVEEMTSLNVPVYYSVHLVTGYNFSDQKDRLSGMRGLIFINISGSENSSDKCKRFKNLLASNEDIKPVTMGLLNIGKVTDNSNAQLIDVLNHGVKCSKLNKWTEEYWKDFESFSRIVKFLALNVDLSNSIRVCTLNSLFDRITEHALNFIDSAKIVSTEFSSALMNPNFVIDCYNFFFEELEELVVNSDLEDYYIVPSEFKGLVRHVDRLGKVSPTDISFNKTQWPIIIESFSKFKLPHLKPWPPQDADELLETLDSYCRFVNCKNILPRLVRIFALSDDIDFSESIAHVSWNSVIDLIVRAMLDVNNDTNKKIVIVYDEKLVSNLCQIDLSFKLLYNRLLNPIV